MHNDLPKSDLLAAQVMQGEYRRLAELIHRLFSARLSHAPIADLHPILAEALDFARVHAVDEEAVMAAVSYPDLDRHRLAHQKIIQELGALSDRVRTGDENAAAQTEALLENWLHHHFADEDRDFHEYLIAFHLRRLKGGSRVRAGDDTVQADEERFRAIVEAAPNAILVVDSDGLIWLANSQAERLFGYSRTELVGKAVEMIVPQRLRDQHTHQRAAFSAAPEVRAMGAGRDLFGLRKDGTEVPIEIGLSPLHTIEGYFVLASIIDISKRKQAEQTVRAAETDLLRESILNNLPASVIATDTEGRILAVNPAAEQMLGYPRGELIGRSAILLHDQSEIRQRAVQTSANLGVEVPPDFRVIVAAGSKDTVDEREWTYCRKDGSRIPVHIAITTLRDRDGRVSGFLTVASDITARRRAEASIRHMANHDALTGLPNRTLLVDRLNMAIGQSRRNQQKVAVLLLDLDQFKQVNDTLGHQVGDELLKTISRRLTGCVREVDTVARLGGDEFVIVVTGVDDVEELAPLIGKLSKLVSLPVRVDHHDLHVTPSIGGSLFPKDGSDVSTLLKKADAAMYRAKASGRGNFKWFTDEMMSESQEKLVLGNSLRHALELNEISLVFQPKVSLTTGHISGTEALLRWRHGEQGDILPARFIPIAEDTGLILPLGEWALRTACRSCVEMQKALQRPVTVAVNVSPRQLGEKLWLQVLRSALDESGLNPNQLELEITESMLMQHPEDSATLLREIRGLGVSVVIDDFGTGYSSLSYLTRFPIDKIKIDRSFVRDLTTDAKDAAVVNAIIAMANRLNIGVVAEGVETLEQQHHLVDEACDEAQGYLYARGLPLPELLLRFAEIESAVVSGLKRPDGVFELGKWLNPREQGQ